MLLSKTFAFRRVHCNFSGANSNWTSSSFIWFSFLLIIIIFVLFNLLELFRKFSCGLRCVSLLSHIISYTLRESSFFFNGRAKLKIEEEDCKVFLNKCSLPGFFFIFCIMFLHMEIAEHNNAFLFAILFHQ